MLLNSVGIREIYEAGNGVSGLEVLREKKCDLILADLAMEPMDGMELTRAIRTAERGTNPFMPIIMITGHTEKHRVEAARDAGVTEFLAKPITAQNLYARIAEIVERPRAFVRCDSYFGPDRRRKPAENYAGPWRRQDDFQDLGRCNEQESPGHCARRLSPDGAQERGGQTVAPAALERHHRRGAGVIEEASEAAARRRARLCRATGTGQRRSPHHGGKAHDIRGFAETAGLQRDRAASPRACAAISTT